MQELLCLLSSSFNSIQVPVFCSLAQWLKGAGNNFCGTSVNCFFSLVLAPYRFLSILDFFNLSYRTFLYKKNQMIFCFQTISLNPFQPCQWNFGKWFICVIVSPLLSFINFIYTWPCAFESFYANITNHLGLLMLQKMS